MLVKVAIWARCHSKRSFAKKAGRESKRKPGKRGESGKDVIGSEREESTGKHELETGTPG